MAKTAGTLALLMLPFVGQLGSYDHVAFMAVAEAFSDSHFVWFSFEFLQKNLLLLAVTERPGIDQLEHEKTILEGDVFDAKCQRFWQFFSQQ